MPRNLKGLTNNRTDLLSRAPTVKPPGQPNGRPIQADVPTGLPYGERGRLTSDIANTPPIAGPPQMRRAMRPPPATTDFTGAGGADAFENAISNWQAPAVTPLTAASERPGEHVMTGAIGRPNSVLPPAAPGNLADLLSGIAQATGSNALAELATRAGAQGA